MHGIVHKAFKEFVESEIDGIDWDSVADEAGLDPKLYLPVTHYPDNEFTGAATALAELGGRTDASIQQSFGRSLVPSLLDTFKAHIRDDWDAREVILALDSIYEQLDSDDGSTTSATVSTRSDGDEIVLTYRSDHELCTVLRGVVLGIADEYGQTAEIAEPVCLREGDEQCELRVTLD
ncbi:heme NO-binding domain-containing protein [Natranaeroarchaeum aerophilus]|uniref:Heme NO-binding domain-containing protein n=1 Tax=Natranaeroarchaeum aerophilus TaxID=2917711 RepID=A0AAE3FP46_9EURY|nr:heme NO-binding domain-containing protein [Natranaeroarchaeum aerophilus]MCL9812298.1 heme NO-binding domain-containing protein [Natranaeroarchaeum aerophilus]